jgi:hypothetical protein
LSSLDLRHFGWTPPTSSLIYERVLRSIRADRGAMRFEAEIPAPASAIPALQRSQPLVYLPP